MRGMNVQRPDHPGARTVEGRAVNARPGQGFHRRYGRYRHRRGLIPLWACRLGATAVEFALVMPIFLAMVLGVIEMSRAMWIKATMQYAVEQTTRYFMVNNDKTTTELETYVQARFLEMGMSSIVSSVTYAATLDDTTTPDNMTITLTYDFKALVSFIPVPDVTLSATANVYKNSS